MRTALLLVAAMLASGCGQTGSLYLPDASVETPVEIRTPGATTPEPDKPEPDKKDEEKKATPPPGR